MPEAAPEPAAIAALMIRWLTHDLASPVATAMTASELLGDEGDGEINELVQVATRRLAARLRLLRTAFAPGESGIGNAALEKLVVAGIADTPITWQYGGDCNGHEAAMIAGATLLLADLRRGSPLEVTAGGVHWASPGTLTDALVAALAGAPASDPRGAVANLVASAAASAGHRLAVSDMGIAWR